MARKKLDEPRPPEISQRDFEPYKNNKLNTHIPHNYNWCLGYVAPPPKQKRFHRRNIPTLPDSRINGQLQHL